MDYLTSYVDALTSCITALEVFDAVADRLSSVVRPHGLANHLVQREAVKEFFIKYLLQ
jgi:hypothetical protein